jgi:hypothetical protein
MLSNFVTFPDMPRKRLTPTEKRAPLGARILPSLIKALQDMADDDDRTLSHMVERAIREYVERHARGSGGGGAAVKAPGAAQGRK